MSKKFIPDNEYQKCAPNKSYDVINNTCFTLEQLIKMSFAYNSINTDKIDFNTKYNDFLLENSLSNNEHNKKKYLLKELIDKLPNTCKSQECLLKEKFVLKLNDHDILYKTLRPLGPKYKIKWLSSSDINQIMYQYTFKYDDYKFFGAIPLDFEKIELPISYELDKFINTIHNLYKDNKYKLGYVINLDKHYQSGSHWVALYINLKDKQIYFFDSYGYKPKNEIKKLMSYYYYYMYKFIDDSYKLTRIDFNNDGVCDNPFNIDIKYNNIRHQFKNSECGVYSINFILRLLNGETFDNITKNITTDDEVNQCRQKYFRFDLNESDS
jgi:hypothetical protein